jgi:2-oxoglutarate ferredoxin oxidoreductase subunit beta
MDGMLFNGNPLKKLTNWLPCCGNLFCCTHSVHTPLSVRKFKKAARLAFENQKLNKGISFIEVVSNCNSGWKMTPNEANVWMEQNMFPFFPPGDIKVNGELVVKPAKAE